MPTSPFRSRRKRRPRWLVGPTLLSAVAAAALLLALSGCGAGSSHTATVQRPHTDAQLQILSPTANQVTGPTVLLRFAVQNATVSPPNKLKLVPNEGHIHVSLDGKLIVMSYGTTTEVHDLSAGLHTLQAEFVANDHLPFANRVIADVIFTVKG